MTYKELLLDPRWLDKRKQIILRDNHKCINCKNQKLVKNAFIGTLIKKGPYHSGMMYRFLGYQGPQIQTVLLETKTNITGKAYVAYFDKEQASGKFGNVIAIRKRYSTRPLETNSENFYNELLDLNEPIEKFDWLHVKSLHVHHTYYQLGRKPWEYPDTALKTLCWVCHEELHKESTVPYLDQFGNEIGTLIPCGKCSGAGYFPEYKHIDEGVCFACQGAKYKQFIGQNFV